MSNFTKATIKRNDKPRLLDVQKRLGQDGSRWPGEATIITYLLDQDALFNRLLDTLQLGTIWLDCDANDYDEWQLINEVIEQRNPTGRTKATKEQTPNE